MDKSKSKDDLRAAGKKRLEEFRQKKQQKGSSNKTSSTAIKALADDQSLSGIPVTPISSVTQPDNELPQKSDGQGTNLAGTLELGFEPPQQAQSSVDDSPVPGDSKLEMPLFTGRKPVEAKPSEASEAITSAESKGNSELVSELDSSDQNHGGASGNKGEETSECTTHSNISPPVGSGQFLQGEASSNGFTSDNRRENASSNSSDIQTEQTFDKEGGEVPSSLDKTQVALEETVKHNYITEIETLKRELQALFEQKEVVSNQLLVKAEQQLEDGIKVKALIADLESIQQELNSVKHEKVQFVEEFNLSQKEIQNTNQRLASELTASQEQLVGANHRATLLSGDLEQSKQEVVEAGTKSAVEMESMQKLVEDGELRISQLMEDLATTKILLQGLQDEKASLNDELSRFEKELHAHGEESMQKGIKLEASKQRIQTLEEDLASEQRALEQLQVLVAEKSQLVEAGRLSNEKLEASLSAKEVELRAYEDQIRNMETENLGLIHQLDRTIRKEEGVRTDFEAQYNANQEQLKQLQDEKAELLDELEKSELLSKKLSDERTSLVAAFDVDREQLREDLRQKEEESMSQAKQLLELRQEFQKLGDEHAQVAKEIEIALDECKIAFDRESDEKSKTKLISARDQLLLLIEEKGQEVANLGNQLHEYKYQLKTKVEENSSLTMLLDESRCQLQETTNRVSEFEAELKKHRAISNGLIGEKETLAAEVLEFQAQCEHMQLTAKGHDLELERVKESLRVLQEDHSKLSSQFTLTADELTNVRTNKSTVELELVTYKDQMTKLEIQNSNLVNFLEDTQNDLQRSREDTLRSSSDFASELDKRRVLVSDLLVEKERLAAELQLAIEQSQYLQQELAQSGKEYNSELEELRNHLRELEDNHSELLNALTVSQSEMAKLKEEKSVAELELGKSREQLTKLEAVNKDLVGGLDRHREQLDAVLDERGKMLGDHVVELDRFREQQRDAEETKAQQTAYLQQLFSDLRDSKNEKFQIGLELETYKEQYRELGDENWKVASEFNKCKDQLQLLTEEKTSAESMLEASKEVERKLEEDNGVLRTELEDQRERQQKMLEHKLNEIEELQQKVNELVESQEQMAKELAETREHSQVLEVARLELLSNMELISQRLNNVSAEKDVLQSDLDGSKQQVQELVKEKGDLTLKFERASENWKAEKLQLSRDLEVSLENEKLLSAGKAQADSKVAELMELAMEVGSLKESVDSLEEQRAHLVSEVKSKDQLLQTLVVEKNQLDSHLQKERERITVYNDQVIPLKEDLGTAKLRIQELEFETAVLKADFKYSQTQLELLTEERSKLVEDLSNHLSSDEKLKNAIEENLHLRDIREQLDGKQHELDTAFVQVDELESQVKELTEKVAHLQAEKNTVVATLYSTQGELRQSNNSLVDERGGLSVLEGTAATLQMERDELTAKLASLEQSHHQLSERALQDSKDKVSLQDQVAAFEVQVAQYDTELRNHKDMVSQSNRLVLSLVQKLEDLIRDVFPEASLELPSPQYNKLSADYHNFLVSSLHVLLQEERTVTVETAEEIRSQLLKGAEEKEKLETSLAKLEAIVSAENKRRDEQASTFANLQSERDELAGKLASLEQNHSHVSEKALQDSKDKVRLQDQVAAFEVQVVECDTELRNHKEMVSQSNLLVQSLVQKLEDLIRDVFPKAREALLSPQYNKVSADYHDSLVSSLQIETTEVCHQVQNAHVHLSEMNKQLQEAEGKLVILQKEKTLAVETAEQIKSQLKKAAEEKEELETSLKKLEAIVSAENVRRDEQVFTLANLQSDRDELVGKLASLEQSHADVSERALYLVQILEDVICEAFPQAGQELLSSQYNKDSPDYHNILVSRLHVEITEVCRQLKKALELFTKEEEQLTKAEDALMILQKEWRMAVESAEQIQSQLMKAVEEKEELLRRLEAIESVENVPVDEQAITLAERAKSEAEALVHQIQNLSEQLENVNAEKESLQTGLAQAEQKLSVTREKLSLAVNKGKAVVQQRDAWKLSLAEKSNELEMLVAVHQQDLHHKDAALNEAEMKIFDLSASVEDMARLEIQLDSFQKMLTTAEQVVLENEHLFHSLCAVLDNSNLPDDWHSIEIVKKMRWITGCLGTLLQELEARKEDALTSMEREATLRSSVEQSEEKVTVMAEELQSREHEKEDLVSRLKDRSSELQLERVQMAEEKAQLTAIIRQQDLDMESQKREKENLATKLQERDKEIVRFEAETTSLVTKLTEQESDLNTQMLSYHRLDATLDTLFSNLSGCYETISPVDIDKVSGDSSLDRCKYILKLLIDNHNCTVVKLQEILSYASEEAVKDGISQSLDDKTLSKEISSGLIEMTEEALFSLEQQGLSLAEERDENIRLQLELTQREARLNTVREKLSIAVSKGKSLVQQKDSLKQALMDKDAELETLATAHKEELESKELLLQEVSKRLTSSLEHAAGLEKDFVSFQNFVASNPGPSLVDRSSEMERQLSETQHRADAAEVEAENSRIAAAVLSSKLELSQTRLDNLVKELNSLTKSKNELVEQLESSANKYRSELQGLIAERTQLMSEISSLQQDLAMRKEERERLVQDYNEASDKCGELRSQAEDIAAARDILIGGTETLQQRIAELEMGLDREVHARMKLESDTEAVVARIQNSTRGPVMDKSVDSLTSSPHSSRSSSQLDSVTALLVAKFEAALQEIEELSNQKAVLAESQQTMIEKAESEGEMLEQLQQTLASRDLELSEAREKIESDSKGKEEEEHASKGVREEVRMLREELAKASSERDALRSELLQIEQKGAITREKLGLAIKKGKGVAQQRDLLKQSISEQQALVTKYKDELQNTESALKKAIYEVSTCEEKVLALELNVSSLKSCASTLEKELQDKENLIKKMEAVLTIWDFPSEWQSKDIAEKLEWLVAALSNAQNSLTVAGQESDALKKASAQLCSEPTDAQRKANLEQESRSMLGLMLESLGELKQSQTQVAELETLLAEVGGVSQQTERLSKEVLEIKKSLQQKQAEVDSTEGTVMAWVKRSEESEKYIQLCQGRILQLEKTVEESSGAEQQIEPLHDKIAHLEEAVQQKEAAVKAMETSRGKAVNKLTLTTNKFRELYQQSEGLVVELERMHKNLEEKDVEIRKLKEEVVKISSLSQISQDALESRRSFQLDLAKLLETAVLSGAHSAAPPPMTEGEDSDRLAEEKSNEEQCIAHVHFIQNQLSGLTVQSQSRQADVERKDVQLQGLRKELDEVIAEKAQLKANLQREQLQSERLKAEIASMHTPPLAERGANQAEEIEEVQIGKRLLPINTPTPHVRGARRPPPIDVAIDMESEVNQRLVEFDDKGHGFKSLTSSRFMPRGTRAIGEQIDRLCVAGGRLLMRQPAARLLVTLYWLAIHVWMVFLIYAAHI